jgi:hypothetical protein
LSVLLREFLKVVLTDGSPFFRDVVNPEITRGDIGINLNDST